ncbi:MAG: methylmalonyl-CoA mutase, N-terminal domain [Actinomycetota bacterium]|jgi:methylmalonyl-CoA mutase N-terminal domain/subunit|nr:methylmalonyl-CoA mutase, N-terminal domain [Actinomycetota bacterium]
MSDERRTDSGIELQSVYTALDLDARGFDPARDLGEPGELPYTRGPYPSMYRGRLWTMRQYAGMATAEESNKRYRYLLDQGQTGLSVAFDLPTQMGLDSDHPRAEGEVGKTGVAIDSVEDLARMLDGIPLDKVSTSMTINATAPILLLMYELVAEEQGVPASDISGTVQNDILKEYAARGTYIYPPRPSMRLITDLFAYCGEHIPKWNTISISGYHMREAGSTAAQEIAFTLADGIAYVQAAIDAGLSVDDFAPRLSFFFACHMNFFEEIAKFRAARRLWARIMTDRFGANAKSAMLRFHTQTGGATLTAQQPENNIVRTALEALAAVLGGTQSLHTNAYDEALALPTEHSATIALRTQQIIGYETGVTETVDPVAGSYLVESLTTELEDLARDYIERVDGMGGAVAAIETGFYQSEIHEAAFRIQQAIESEDRIVVGVNRFVDTEDKAVALMQVSAADTDKQIERVRALRASRDDTAVTTALAEVRTVAVGTGNLLPSMKEALRVRATLGELSDVLREVFGEYRPTY